MKVICIIIFLLISGILIGSVRAESIEEKFQSTINNWMKFFETNLEWFSLTVTEFMKRIIKITYFAIGLTGFVLWASGFSKYTGKRLMIGALVMGFVAEVLL